MKLESKYNIGDLVYVGICIYEHQKRECKTCDTTGILYSIKGEETKCTNCSGRKYTNISYRKAIVLFEDARKITNIHIRGGWDSIENAKIIYSVEGYPSPFKEEFIYEDLVAATKEELLDKIKELNSIIKSREEQIN
jgi:hypothetical protein